MSVIPARRTMYSGIAMRSRLEAKFAAWLDGHGIEWEYEPECFADPSGQYLPDFRFRSTEGHRVYVEVKGPPLDLDPDNRCEPMQRMEIIWASEPDAELAIVREGETWLAGPLNDFEWHHTGPGAYDPDSGAGPVVDRGGYDKSEVPG